MTNKMECHANNSEKLEGGGTWITLSCCDLIGHVVDNDKGVHKIRTSYISMHMHVELCIWSL